MSNAGRNAMAAAALPPGHSSPCTTCTPPGRTPGNPAASTACSATNEPAMRLYGVGYQGVATVTSNRSAIDRGAPS
ncbi:MAG: hypothetical protein U0Q19_07780 [Kineosporiaceae bacterium]